MTNDTAPALCQINPRLRLDVWYDRPSRTWWAAYFTTDGDQHGPAWHDATRDRVLIFRPDPLPLCD